MVKQVGARRIARIVSCLFLLVWFRSLARTESNHLGGSILHIYLLWLHVMFYHNLDKLGHKISLIKEVLLMGCLWVLKLK
jgi:hypothetical protein